MSETKTETQQFKMRRGLSFVWFKILGTTNFVLNLFSLKQNTRYWGIVFDSLSKQPLDPVIIKLMYVDGREAETCVTDIAGRYGFLARPGKFKILARKTNYLFPSKYSPGDRDGIYENLYHGEFFNLSDDYEVVAPNIPMDPEGSDWNQKAKLKVINRSPYLRYFFKLLVAILFWFGFILAALIMVVRFPKIPSYLYAVVGAYLALLILALLLPEVRLWGRVKTKIPLASQEFLYLELHDLKFPEIIFGKTHVKDDGKFLLRSNKGNYLLMVGKMAEGKRPQVLASLPVSVGRGGVLNSTIILS
jgi:hypothetical protein